MKKAIKSKTIIFNVLSILVAAGMFASTNPALNGNVKDLIIAVIGVINIVLRWKGNTPIKGVV